MPKRAERKREGAPRALETALERHPARLGPVYSNVFQEVGLGASLTDGKLWHPIHSAPDVVSVEYALGLESRRGRYNDACIARARRTGRALVGSHAGFHDLFVPLGPERSTVLVAGPFAKSRPTSAEVVERWRTLKGAQARATDPEFSHYLALTLGTATFEGAMLASFVSFGEAFCALLEGGGTLRSSMDRAVALRSRLADVRHVDRCWSVAAQMVDERTSNAWTSPHWAFFRRFLGTERLPSHAVVGLVSARIDEPDAIEQMLRTDAFQRASVGLARKLGGVVSGKVGTSGVMLLVDQPGTGARAQVKLVDIAERVRALARRFELSLHVGVSEPSSRASLPKHYEAALGAAENALVEGRKMVIATAATRRALSPLGELRSELARDVGSAPGTLGPRFDRYLDVVAQRSGYRLDPIRAHAEAGFDQIVATLRVAGALDASALTYLKSAVDGALEAPTVPELFAIYRRAVLDLEQAVLHPKDAEQDRNLRRATTFIREHFGEPLSLARVARVAGFAPTYFSALFARTEKTTLPRYIRRVRVERAKKMLETTSLAVERIGQLCGFRTRSSFHTAFHAIAGTTPRQYRSRLG